MIRFFEDCYIDRRVEGDFMSKWLTLIFTGLIISAIAAQEPQYVLYDWDEPGSWTVCDVEGYIRQATLEFDSKGVAHVLFTHEETEGCRLYYTSNETGEFVDPVPLLLMDTGCQVMESRIGPDDALHLVWLDETYPDNIWPKGWIRYLKVQDGAVASNLVLFQHPDGAYHLSFDLDRSGNVFAVTELAERILTVERYQKNVDPQIVFLRIIDGQVQDPIIRRFYDKQSDYVNPIIHVAESGIVYFLAQYWGPPLLLTYLEGEFTEPIPVTDKVNEGSYPAKMITDQTGDLHIYFTEWPSMNYPQYPLWHIISTDCGVTFSEPDLLVSTSDLLVFVSRPLILPDNTPFVATRTRRLSGGSLFCHGYYHLDRGYGYGNPFWLGGGLGAFHGGYEIEPQIRIRSGYRLSALKAYFSRDAQYVYHSRLTINNFELKQFEQPHVLINSIDVFLSVLDKGDRMRLALDIYNPRPEPLEADLAIVMEFEGVQDGIYYFLSFDGGLPVLTTDYRTLRLTLPPGWSCQNVPVLELDVSLLYGIISGVIWHSYAALIDPETGLMLGELSTARTRITF
jgi:hypothetical protein